SPRPPGALCLESAFEYIPHDRPPGPADLATTWSSVVVLPFTSIWTSSLNTTLAPDRSDESPSILRTSPLKHLDPRRTKRVVPVGRARTKAPGPLSSLNVPITSSSVTRY